MLQKTPYGHSVRPLGRKASSAKRASLCIPLAKSISVACAAFTLGSSPVCAQTTNTWIGNGSANFGDPNWTTINAGGLPVSGDALEFGLGGSAGAILTDNLFTTSFSLTGITFDAGASAYTINAGAGGGAFTLSGSITNNSTSLQTINDAITLANGAQTITTTVGGGNVTLGGAISGTTSTSGITLNGGGTLTLLGVNTYSGTTTVNGGTLEFKNETSLYNNTQSSWTSSNIIVGSGATLMFGVGGTGQFTSSDLATLLSLGTATGGFTSGSFAGFDTTGGAFTYSNVIANPNGGSNTLGVVVAGSNTLTLSAANTYTGGTMISAGTLRISNLSTSSNAAFGTSAPQLGSGTVTFTGNSTFATASGSNAVNVANNFTINGGVTGSFDAGYADIALTGAITGAGGIAKASSGNIYLLGANTYSGGTTLGGSGSLFVTSIGTNNAGTVSSLGSTGGINYTTNASLVYMGLGETTDRIVTFSTGNGGTFTNNGAGLITFSSNMTAANAAMGVTFNGGEDVIIQGITGDSNTLNFNKSGLGTLTVNGNVTSTTGSNIRAQGGVLSFASTATTSSNSTIISQRTVGGVLEIANGASILTAADANTNGIMGGWATFNGTDWAQVNGAGTAISAYSGYTSDAWTSTNNTTVTTSSAPTAASTTNSLRFASAGADTITLSGLNGITTGGILVTSGVGSNTTTITGGTLIRPLTSSDLIINQFNTAGGLTIGSVIGGLAESGTTTSTSKVITGLASTANFYVGMPVSGTGIPSGSTIASVDSATQVTLNNAATASGTVNVTFANNNAVTVVGPGITTFTGANTYTGTTYVIGGATLIVNANSGGKVYSVSGDSTLKLGYGTGNSVYSYGVTVNGAGAAATTGLYLSGGQTYDFQSTLTLAGAPTTIHSYGTGNPTVAGYDTNNTHLSVNNTASGSAFDSGIKFSPGSYGYVMNISPGINNTTGDLTINGPLTGSAGNGPTISGIKIDYFVNKSGATGSLKLAAANTYTDGIQLYAGSIIMDSGGTLPSASGIVLGSSANSAKLVLNGTSQTLAAIATSGTGTANAIVGRSATLSTLTINDSANLSSYSGILGGSGSNENNLALTKTGAGTLTLTGANTYFGPTTISNGTLQIGNGGTTGSISSATSITGTGGTLAFNRTDSITFPNVISGAVSLTQAGTGTLTLTGANTSTGSTNVNAGTLALSGSGAVASTYINVAATGTLNVSGLITGNFGLGSGQTLSVSAGGTLVGATTLNTGSVLIAGRTSSAATDISGNLTVAGGTVNVGGTGIAGTLSVAGDLTLSGGTLSLELSNTTTAGNGVNDLLSVSNLNLAAATTVAVGLLNGTLPNATYTIINYSGTLSGSVSNLSVNGGSSTSRQSFTFGSTAVSNGSITLTVAGTVADLTWLGDGVTNTWDVVTTPNFLNNGSTDKFYNGDNVTFDDTGLSSPAITVNSVVQPGSVTVNNSINPYTFAGSGSIAGSTGLTKNGTSTLTITTTNSFTGPVAINNGTVSVDTVANGGSNSPLGAGTVISLGDSSGNTGDLQYTGLTASTNRALALNAGGGTVEVTTAGNTLTVGGVVSGTGALTKQGPGTLGLSGANTFSGNTTVAAGSLALLNKLALQNSTLTTGGVIFDSSVTPAAFTLGALSGTGAIALQNNATTPAAVALTVGANGSSTTYGGILSGPGSLTKVGNGYLTLTAANTYTGTTTVNGGTLEVQAKSGDVAYVVAQGATLMLGYSTGGGYSPSITVNGSGIGNPAGLYLLGGKTIQSNGGIIIQTAPTTIQTYGTGNATIQGFDVNSAYFLYTTAAASGSVVASTINLSTGTYGYRLQTDAGTNTATGDLTINGVLSGSAGAGVGFPISTGLLKFGTGSLKLTGANTYTAATGIANGSIILSGTDNRLPVGTTVVLGSGSTSGQLVLGDSNGPVNQTIVGLQTNGTGVASAVVGGNSAVSTLALNNTAAVTFAGTLGGAGTNQNNLGFTQAGTGTTTLSGNSPYTGTTLVNAGTLVVTGNLSGTTAMVTGGTLAGTGTIGGGLNVIQGTIAPGVNGTGTLSINNAVNLTSAATLSMQANGAGSGQVTQLSAVGMNLDADFSGGATLQLTLGNGYVPAGGDLLVLALNSGSITGTFANTGYDSNPQFFGGAQFVSYYVGSYEFAVSYNATATSFTGGDGIALMAIPEPSTLLTLIGGLGMLTGIKRFRRRS